MDMPTRIWSRVCGDGIIMVRLLHQPRETARTFAWHIRGFHSRLRRSLLPIASFIAAARLSNISHKRNIAIHKKGRFFVLGLMLNFLRDSARGYSVFRLLVFIPINIICLLAGIRENLQKPVSGKRHARGKICLCGLSDGVCDSSGNRHF